MLEKIEDTLKKLVEDETDVVDEILQHHRELKVFVETMNDEEAPLAIVNRAFSEFVPLLLRHIDAEQAVLYPAMKEKNENLRLEALEGETEHSMEEALVDEINEVEDRDDWIAKVKVLSDSVEHHLHREESKFLKHVRKEFDLDERIQMREDYLARYRLLDSH